MVMVDWYNGLLSRKFFSYLIINDKYFKLKSWIKMRFSYYVDWKCCIRVYLKPNSTYYRRILIYAEYTKVASEANLDNPLGLRFKRLCCSLCCQVMEWALDQNIITRNNISPLFSTRLRQSPVRCFRRSSYLFNQTLLRTLNAAIAQIKLSSRLLFVYKMEIRRQVQ